MGGSRDNGQQKNVEGRRRRVRQAILAVRSFPVIWLSTAAGPRSRIVCAITLHAAEHFSNRQATRGRNAGDKSSINESGWLIGARSAPPLPH